MAGKLFADSKLDFVELAGMAPVNPEIYRQLNQDGYARSAGDDVGINAPQSGVTTGNPFLDATARSTGASQYSTETTRGRYGDQPVRDGAVTFVNQAIQGVLGMGALGVGLVNDEAGAAVSRGAAAVDSFAKGIQSDGLNSQREAKAARDGLTSEFNRRQEQADRSNGDSDFVAGLKRVGRDVIDSVNNNSPMTIADGIVGGLGSFAVGGLVGKGLTKLGMGARSAMGVSIGTQEGGGAYQQTVNEVLNMSHEQLMAGSTAYEEMIQRGMSPEDARIEVATSAGLKAAAIQAPIGVATGALLSAGESRLFRVPSVTSGLAKPVNEGFEEAIQSGAGQLATNEGVRAFADANRDMLGGVGQAVGEGALFGFGTGAVMSAPGTTAQAASQAARKGIKLVARTGTAIRDRINSRADQITGELEAESPVSAQSIAPVYEEAAAEVAAPETRAAVEAAAVEKTNSPEEAKAVVDHFDKLREQMLLDPREADNESSPVIADALRASTNKFSAIQRIAAIAGDVSRPRNERIEAGMYLAQIESKHGALIEALNESVTLTDDNDPRLQTLRKFEDVLLSLGQVPQVQKAIQAALADAAQITPADLDESGVRATVAAAKVSPTSVNPETVQTILSQARNMNLNAEDKAALQIASQALQAIAIHAKKVAELKLGEKGADIVSREIRSDTIEGKQKSAAQHMQAVTSAMSAGNLSAARAALDDFVLFAIHMQNKVEALNENLESGRREPTFYQSLTGNRRWVRSTTGLRVHTGNTESIRFAQRIANDAAAVGAMANILVARYPELAASQIQLVQLDERLNGKAEDVRFKFAEAKRRGETVPKANRPTEIKPVPQAEPAQEKPETSASAEAPAQTPAPKAAPAQEKPQRPASELTDDELNDEVDRLTPKLVRQTLTPEERARVDEVDDEIQKREDLDRLAELKELAKSKILDAGERDQFRRLKKKYPSQAEPAKAAETSEASEAKPEQSKQPEPTPAPAQTNGEAFAAKVSETTTNDKAVWQQLTAEFQELSPADQAQALEIWNGYKNVEPASGPLFAQLNKALRELSAQAGIDFTPLVHRFFVRDSKDGDSGSYHFAGQSISVSREYIQDFGSLKRLIAHELGHAIDWASSDEGLSSWLDMFDRSGDLFAEFSKLQQENILPANVDKPLWNYINESFKDGNDEFFAEMVAFVLLNPALAKELVPNVTEVVQDGLQWVAEAQGLSLGNGTPGPTQSRDAPAASPEVAPAPEPTPEPTPEPAPAPQQVPVAPDGDFLANLVENPEAGILNWFKQSFKLVEGKSRLVSLGAGMVDAVREALSSNEAFARFADKNALRGTLTAPLVGAYEAILNSTGLMAAAMDKRLQEFLDTPVAENAPTFRDGLLNGSTKVKPNEMLRGKVLNLLDRNGDELGYNENFRQAAMLAGLQWVLGQSQSGRTLDEDDVLKILGVRFEEQVDGDLEELANAFNEGTSEELALRSLAQIIQRFWGVSANQDGYVGFTDGIPQAMAAEVLYALEQAGIITAEPLNVKLEGDEDRTFRLIKITADKELLAIAREKPDLLERLATAEPEEVWHIGQPPKRVAPRQMRNRLVANTAEQLKAIAFNQNIPFKLNMPFLSFLTNIGDELALTLFGPEEITDATNINHAKSLAGKKLTISNALETVSELVSNVQNYAESTGAELKDVPIHYEFNISRVGRAHMLGKNNPQSNKLMREVSLPTQSVIDLSNPSDKPYGIFMLAIAQHLGEKVHKVDRKVSVANIEAKLAGDFAPAVELFRQWLSRENSGTPLQLTRGDINLLVEALGREAAPGAVHAIMDYARYLNAKESGDLSKFETSLYVEADGVTDGPINAMVHMGLGLDKDGNVTGEFTPHWIRMVGKGGLFFSNKPMSIADYIQMSDENGADLYEVTTDAFRKIRHDLIKGAGPAVQKQSQQLLILLRELMGKDVKLENGKLIIERGIAKNPLTVTIYGSGANGIAGKFVHILKKSLYEQLSKDGLSDDAWKALEALTQNVAVVTKKGNWDVQKVNSDTLRSKNGKLSGLTLTKPMIGALRTNLLNMFVKPLQEAIQETIGEVYPATQAMQKAIQVQSIFLAAKQDQLIAELLEAKKTDPNWKSTYSLKRSELANVIEALRRFAPFVETGTQNFFIAGSETTRVGKSDVARGLGDDYKMSLLIDGVADAGVKGTPTMVIGPGDGQMLQSFAVTPGAPANLPVFDGINFSIKDAEKGSELVNQAVGTAWSKNPLGSVAQSFNSFMEAIGNEGLSSISDDRFRQIARAFVGKEKAAGASRVAIENELKRLQADLTDMSEIIADRHAVISDVATSIDHMATMQSPSVSQGAPVLGTPEEQAVELNSRLKERREARGKTLGLGKPRNMVIPTAGPNLTGFGSAVFGADARLVRIREAFQDKIVRHLGKMSGPMQIVERRRIAQASTIAADRAISAMANGFPMNMQQRSTFEMLVQTLATQVELDPNALARMNEIWEHVTANLRPSMFMQNPENPDMFDAYQAQQKFDVVMGVYGTDFDKKDRSTLLPVFMALGVVHDGFRDVLRKMPMPASNLGDGKTLDSVLENAGTRAMDSLDQILSGEKGAKNVREALDNLTDRIAQNEQDQQSFITQISTNSGNALDKANDWIIDKIDQAAVALEEKIDARRGQPGNSKLVDGALAVGKALTGIVNEDRADLQAQGLMSLLNRNNVPKAILDLFNEVIGRTGDNAAIYDMIKAVRSYVQQVRQQFREQLPLTIAKQFSRKVTNEEWTAMFKGMAKTDLAALSGPFSLARIMSMLEDPATVSTEVTRMEEIVQREAGRDWNLIKQKSEELARFMSTGEVTTGNLLRNAEAIANLLGERPANNAATPALVKAVDQLVSLYALEILDPATQKLLSNLAKNEKKGMAFTMSSLVGQAVDERAKAARTGQARFNHYKGHVPTEQEQGVSLIVAPDADYTVLRQRGYARVANYVGSRAEGSRERKSYYFAPVSGRASYHQGILQNVRQTAYGVDPRTGFTLGRMVADRITEPQAVYQLKRRLRANTGGEPLLPVYDAGGEIVAFERSVDPRIEAKLNYNSNMAEVMGIWRGRQMEELNSQIFNGRLIAKLAEKWDSQKAERRGEYINLFDRRVTAKDPILADAVKLITPEARAEIASHFEEGEFWVRRDMIDDALGYRALSVGDAWTGNSRMDPKTQEVMRRVALAVFGTDAYKYLTKAENIWQNFISDARVTIVVKSGIVPLANMMSNVVHLMSIGVPIADIINGAPRKVAELNTYTKNQLKRIELEAELFNARASNDLGAIRRMETGIQSIDDANKRLSIWPLIEAGEFSSVTEAGINHDDLLLSSGKLNQYLEKMVDKLPDAVKTAGRYAIVSQDTALFKGLQRAVQYGDFVAKALMYDDLVKRKGRDPAYARGRITEEFINFDRAAGRTRTYLESMGMIWFWHFKLRSMKIAMATVRNNPLQVFLSSLLPMPTALGSIGTPVSDNLAAVAWDGRLGYSIGPDQAFRAYALNPALNIMT